MIFSLEKLSTSGLFPLGDRPDKRHMGGEFIKILEGKIRKEILREFSAQSFSEGKTSSESSPSPHFLSENDMIGFSWLLGDTHISPPTPTTRAQKVYGVAPRPRPPHKMNQDQRKAFDLLRNLSPSLNENFTHSELKTAWRAAALRTHPDKGGTNESFRQSQFAYKTLEKLLTNSKK